jgi:hypothetical protein
MASSNTDIVVTTDVVVDRRLPACDRTVCGIRITRSPPRDLFSARSLWLPAYATYGVVNEVSKFRGAMGVVHGPAGSGKTFVVKDALESVVPSDWQTIMVTSPAQPSMRYVAAEIHRVLTGTVQ